MNWLLVILLLVPLAGSLATRQSTSFIALPLRRGNSTGVKPRHARRVQPRETPYQPLIDLDIYYFADIGIGNPPQEVVLHVDTASWTTWVNPDCRTAAWADLCLGLGQYSPGLSTPAPSRVKALDQELRYGSGGQEYVSLVGYSDTFIWGWEVQVPNQAFAIAERSRGVDTGILGLSIDGVAGFDSEVSNLTVVGGLAREGIIASRAFSLALGATTQIEAETGALVFGGIDKNRFSGPLFKVPILEPGVGGADRQWRYWVELTEISHAGDGLVPSQSIKSSPDHSSFTLDSGTNGLYLPANLFNYIADAMGVDRVDYPPVACSVKDDAKHFAFKFGGDDRVIHVSYNDLVHYDLGSGQQSCYVAVAKIDPVRTVPMGILGMEFLKAAYVIFDWDNREIHMAQGANCGTPDVVSIGSGPNSVPNAKGNCKA